MRALFSTLLIIEIATIFSETSVWALVSELYLPGVVMMPALALTGAGMLALGVRVFRMALSAERRMDEADAETADAGPEMRELSPSGKRSPNEIDDAARPRGNALPPNAAPPRPKRDRSSL